MVTTGFKRDVRSCARGVAVVCLRIAYRHDFGVCLPCGLGKALPNDLMVAHQHAAHARIGRREAYGVFGEGERGAQEIGVHKGIVNENPSIGLSNQLRDAAAKPL